MDTDAPGFYRLRVRPQSEWVDNRPVLDAFAADLQPCAHGIYFQRGYRGTAAARSDSSLTPDEYLALYRALPTRDDMRLRPAAARIALESWERRHASLVTKYPASVILGGIRRELGP